MTTSYKITVWQYSDAKYSHEVVQIMKGLPSLAKAYEWAQHNYPTGAYIVQAVARHDENTEARFSHRVLLDGKYHHEPIKPEIAEQLAALD